ncbi:hypothetical protein CYY_002470 [Polysphondylium violaceum]|uniref:Phosphoglucomutase A n=1 Tax=Polysphondylium violaceum TaxID=133409 RepID=A0A8J4V9L3_9MYCE|nr:hypothetical protein CYY_002470 [Polysphondylium violaceum]
MNNLEQLIQQWRKWDTNPATLKEIQDLLDKKDENELKARLESRIAFGTAGLRGPMKAGFSCMNDVTVRQASQGLCSYVDKVTPNARHMGVVIGYDGRHHSKEFANITAQAFLKKNFKVYLFETIVPTPFVAFATPELKAAVGVMITASHNPKDDNGYKVYWHDGCQINTPHDKYISQHIESNLETWTESCDLSKVVCPLKQIEQSYFSKIAKYSVAPYGVELAKEPIVYTAMHGVGYNYVIQSFEAFKLPPVIPTEQQVGPDADFPTVAFPNPEEGKGALKLAIETAERVSSRLILANDPDADRLAVAERQADGSWKVFNGNEIGVLFADWAWTHGRKAFGDNVPPNKFAMVTTAVSSSMMNTMAKKEGFSYREVLTGFKWVGNAALDFIKSDHHFLFAYEEAIGFMYGDVSLDKDGVRCAAIFAELALSLYQQKSSCQEHLDSLYKKYGYHISKNRYFFCYDPKKMESIFNRIRSLHNGTYPSQCGSFKIVRTRDLTTGYDDGFETKKAILPTSSSTQMITFYFENGGIATLRGSGTEPKLKYYVEMVGQDKSNVEQTLGQLVKSVIDEFLCPVENQLTPPKDD